MSVFSREFILARISALEIALTENEAAAKKTRAQYQYSIDTGQTRQSVTNQQLSQLTSERVRIESDLAYWFGQLRGGGSHTGTPGW